MTDTINRPTICAECAHYRAGFPAGPIWISAQCRASDEIDVVTGRGTWRSCYEVNHGECGKFFARAEPIAPAAIVGSLGFQRFVLGRRMGDVFAVIAGLIRARK
jgi:hypothetical protein